MNNTKILTYSLLALFLAPMVLAMHIRDYPVYNPRANTMWEHTTANFDESYLSSIRPQGSRAFYARYDVETPQPGSNFHCATLPCGVGTRTPLGYTGFDTHTSREACHKDFRRMGMIYNRCLFNVDEYDGCEMVDYSWYWANRNFCGTSH